MLDTKVKSQHSTRPYIAKHAFHALALISILAVSAWTLALYNQFQSIDEASINQAAAMAKSIENGWSFILSVIGSFVTLLMAYFGTLRKEKNDKLNSIYGHEINLGGFSNV